MSPVRMLRRFGCFVLLSCIEHINFIITGEHVGLKFSWVYCVCVSFVFIALPHLFLVRAFALWYLRLAYWPSLMDKCNAEMGFVIHEEINLLQEVGD